MLTDFQIAVLLAEIKPLPRNWQARLRTRLKANCAYTQRELEILGDEGNRFRLILRHSTINPLDFSVILTFKEVSGSDFVLIRHNGKHPSQHTNKLEKQQGLPNSSFRNAFHIHRATERYQQAGYDAEGYAEETNSYSSFPSAIDWMINNYGFRMPADDAELPPPLFRSEGDDQ